MRTLLNIFSVRNAIKRKKDLFSLKRSATCAMAKNNLLKRFATSALRFKLRNAHLCVWVLIDWNRQPMHYACLSCHHAIFFNKLNYSAVVITNHGSYVFRQVSQYTSTQARDTRLLIKQSESTTRRSEKP